MKICTRCKLEKDEEDFSKHKMGKDGLRPTCKTCTSEITKDYKKRRELGVPNPERLKPYGSKNDPDYSRRASLHINYGITLEQYNELFQKQNGCCAICGIHQSLFKRRLDVDHCHSTGEIRGLLCNSCNQGIGLLKEDKEILSRALVYLK